MDHRAQLVGFKTPKPYLMGYVYLSWTSLHAFRVFKTLEYQLVGSVTVCVVVQ